MAIQDFTNTPLSDLVNLKGKSAVVTGGARGLGRAIGRRLAEAGATVYLADLDYDEAQKAAGELDGDVHATRLDATQQKDHQELAEKVLKDCGSLDIWVNNAGIYPFEPFNKMEDDDWDKVVDVNLNGVFYGSQAASRRMVDQGSGVIVNIASTAGYGAEGGNIAHYCATKHAVRGLTKSLAFELGPKGVRSIAIAPTLIETPGTLSQKEDISEGMGVDDAHEAFANQIPLRRIGMPDDVARTVLFAATDLAGFVSGDTILVDGGLRAR